MSADTKPDAAVNFASLGHAWLLEVVAHVRDDGGLPDGIKNTVERARSSGSRIANQRAAGERLRKARAAKR